MGMSESTIDKLILLYESKLEDILSFKSLSADGVSKTNHDVKAIQEQLDNLYLAKDRLNNGILRGGRVGGGVDIYSTEG
jgi:hypothetical protein